MRPSFYRRLWRFNAFVVAAIGILGILAVAAMLATLAPELQRHYGRAGQGNLAPPEAAASEIPALSDQERIVGTPFLATKIGIHSGGSSGLSSRAENGDRNIMLLDLRNGSSRHILPDNSRTLVQWHVLSAQGDKSESHARAYAALVSAPPSGGFPRYDILIGNFATGRQAWAARGVTAMDAVQLVGDDAIVFLAWDGRRLSYFRYGLQDLVRQAVRPVPIMTKKGVQ